MMEGLISARIIPVCAYCRQHHSPLTPTFTLRLAKRVLVSPFGTMKYPKRLNSVVAPVQLLEASAAGHLDNTLPSKEVLEVWQNADAVCFDVDSTVCLDEGIDELAEFCGAGKAVAEAMGGSVPFEEALSARLSLFNPSLTQVQDFLEKHPPRISPGIDELVKKQKAKNTAVYLISGGFRQMINRSGGKATAVQQIRKAYGYKALVMIGDGATDLEARKPGGANLFICYAGVQLREAVATNADWLVFNFGDLISSLE
ncbi:unnamed protein product [Camellia sinensis]